MPDLVGRFPVDLCPGIYSADVHLSVSENVISERKLSRVDRPENVRGLDEVGEQSDVQQLVLVVAAIAAIVGPYGTGEVA